MPRIELSRYHLPPGPGRKKPYPSSWRMSAEEAAARGLTEKDKVPGSEWTPTELGLQSAGHDGVRTNKEQK